MPRSANATPAAKKLATTRLRDAVRASVRPGDRLLLAVSGGRDSMVLLDAMARWRRAEVVAVATFDHGTGVAARDAVALVRAAARGLTIRFVHGRASGLAPSEASWRDARWGFLRDSAELVDARVVTAHTEDDQIETVFMRVMRGTGARGIAGLLADSDVVRPLITVSRAHVATYAAARGIPFIDDPSNASPKFFRNRVRMDLLPAAEKTRPGFGAELLELSYRAATIRNAVEQCVDALAPRHAAGVVTVNAAALLAHDASARAVLWPALAARAGVILDRRGTARLAAFTARTGRTNRVQLSGGHEVVRHAETFEIRPAKLGAR